MMKQLIIIVSIWLVLLSVKVFANPTAQASILSFTAPPPGSSSLTNSPRPLAVITAHEFNSQANYDINLSYPQSTNNAHANFNQLISNLVNQQLRNFKQAVAASNKQTDLPTAANYLTISYVANGFTAKTASLVITSLRFSIEKYVRGMAHPEQNTLVINYDLTHDKVLQLADLFPANTDYLKLIANYCQQQLLNHNLPDEIMVKQGSAPTLSNYHNWSLTNNGLLITFDPAQVAPHYYGPQNVLIPNKVLVEMVTPPVACALGLKACDAK